MPKTTPLFIVIALMLGIVAGFFAGRGSAPLSEREPATTKPAITEQDLPVSLTLLQNPVVGQWRIDVRGRLVNKTETTFTIEEQNSRLTISAEGFGFPTQFLDTRVVEHDTLRAVLLNDIPLGSYLRGTALVLERGQDIRGMNFYIHEGP